MKKNRGISLIIASVGILVALVIVEVANERQAERETEREYERLDKLQTETRAALFADAPPPPPPCPKVAVPKSSEPAPSVDVIRTDSRQREDVPADQAIAGIKEGCFEKIKHSFHPDPDHPGLGHEGTLIWVKGQVYTNLTEGLQAYRQAERERLEQERRERGDSMIRDVKRADGSVRYEVYGRRAGKKVYVSAHESEREAKSAERRWLVTQEQIDAGELPPETDLKRTLKEGVDEWLASLKAGKSRSLVAYGEFMHYQVLPKLGTVSLAKLAKSGVMNWRDDVATEYAPTTVNSALTCLSSAFGYFIDRGWVKTNPCRGVSRLEVHERAYNWIKTRGELERLLATSADELRDMIAFAVGTGVRIDEQLHLQWTDINFEQRLICVQRGEQGTVKGGRIRHVPILDALLDMLKARALKRDGAELVFPGKAGKVRDKPGVRRMLRAALRRAGLDERVRWHDLRHTCASWWVLAGGDIFRLSKLLGHRSVVITEQWYAHLAPEAWQQDYARLVFHVPTEPAKIYEIRRDENGKLAGRRVIGGEKRETAAEDAKAAG